MLAFAFLSILLAGSLPEITLPDANPLEISPEMEQFVASQVGFGLAPKQRLHLLISAIFQDKEMNFAYTSVSRSASETFRHRNGNCLSFTLMFIAMARYLDMDARFCEVQIPPAFTKRGEAIILIQHLKPVVFIAGEAYAVDLFPAIIPIGAEGQIVTDQRGFAHFFSNQGVAELGNGNDDLAYASFKKALALDDTAFSAWINLGTAHFRAGNMVEAENCYRKALALSPKNPAIMSNLANVYAHTGRPEEARRLKKKVQQFREKNPYYHFDLGMQAYKQGNYQKSLAHYQRAIQLNSLDPVFYIEIARSYDKLGKPKQVLENLKLARKTASQSEDKLQYEETVAAMKSFYSAAEKH
jgi:tetratricopeptide (TPR) repeat protein